MSKIAIFLALVPLTVTSAYARPHHHHHRRSTETRQVAPYYGYSAHYVDMPNGYMPSAGELSPVNTGGYAHPEGSGTINGGP